ncbi:hypothetical protein MASR1M8_00350 [Thermomonas brevis]
MKILVPPEKHKLFERLPRKDRPPFSEIAAVQTFKLMAWATATGGIYLLADRSGETGLRIIPYLLWMLIVWDMQAKLGWEPDVERVNDQVYVVLPRMYWLKLLSISLLSFFVAWAVIFWLAPLINQHGLANL